MLAILNSRESFTVVFQVVGALLKRCTSCQTVARLMWYMETFFQFWISLGKERSDRLSVELKDDRLGPELEWCVLGPSSDGVWPRLVVESGTLGGGQRHKDGSAGKWIEAGGGDLGWTCGGGDFFFQRASVVRASVGPCFLPKRVAGQSER